MDIAEFKERLLGKNSKDLRIDYEDDVVVTRKICAVILHSFLQQINHEKDEIDISSAMVLKDIYDCRICANHIAQVYVKGIMKEGRMIGDVKLFDLDAAASEYKEVSLPLASGENGAKGFTIEYEEPEDLVIRYSIKEAGLSRSEEVNDDYINYWWTEESTRLLRSVYWAEIREGKYPAIRCYVEPLPRGGASLGFDLSYRDGKYEIGYVELDAPDGPF